MEGYVNAGERNGSKTAFEFNIAFVSLLLLGPLVGADHDLSEHLLDFLDCMRFCKLKKVELIFSAVNYESFYLRDVNFLDLQKIQYIGYCLKRHKFSSADILLTLKTGHESRTQPNKISVRRRCSSRFQVGSRWT